MLHKSTQNCLSVGAGAGGSSRGYSRLHKQSLKIVEENNVLKYKVELLLDMLAASNADCVVMQKELDGLRRAHSHHHKRAT